MRPRPTLNRIMAVTLAAAVLALAGCGGGVTPGSPQAESTPGGDAQAPAPQPTQQAESGLHVSSVKLAGDERAVITTSKGVIELDLFGDKAPNTVASFVELAQRGFYDGLKFHRVVPGFVIQGGDPLSRTDDPAVGTGGPGWTMKAEFNDAKHVEGTLAMARSQDPDSAGSQFYICLGPQPSLDGQYTVFGQVTKGMEVVRAIQVGDVITSIKIVHGS